MQSSSAAELDGGLVTPAQQREPQRPGAHRSRPPPLDTTQQGLAAAPTHLPAGSGPLGSLLAQLGSSSLQHPAAAGQVRHPAHLPIPGHLFISALKAHTCQREGNCLGARGGGPDIVVWGARMWTCWGGCERGISRAAVLQ